MAKGPGSAWYTGNSPGQAISIFFSDGQGGVFYKSIPLPGSPTDITVSRDGKWLAVIYAAAAKVMSASSQLTPTATSHLWRRRPSVGVAAFSGVAFSQ